MSCAESNTSKLARPAALALPALITAAVMGVATLVLFCFDPSHHAFYPVCVFHRSTGLLCPGCGSLRALHQLLHGHVLAALHDNALLVCSSPLLGIWAGRSLVRQRRHQPGAFAVSPVWLWAALVVLVVFGITRNLPLETLAWLRP